MVRKAMHILRLLLASGFWLLSSAAFAQNVFSSEDDLKKQANKLFEEEDFAGAYPLFSQLLSLYPKDAQYNYRFGTCLLYSSGDKEKAIPYLEYAAKRQDQGADKEAFFYLAKAYHLNYRFAEAERLYNKYKSVASARQMEKYKTDRQIEMCANGKRLLKNVTDLSVLEKKEVPDAEFYRSYNLSEFNAKLIIKPDDLKSPFDKKKKEEDVIYLAPDRDQIYYSSYGADGKNGKDIFYVTRSSSGDLSAPTRAAGPINTPFDEDFPFFHPNGRTLYFCSKGHNSMGGYDIFKSEWDDKTSQWGRPVNMDFAINTPDDDILFISDSEDKGAYFSSRRESPSGMIVVYRIKLDRKPLDLAIIKGTLTKEVGDRSQKAKITVTKILKDEVVGVFNTNAADGSYTLNLPNGGKFMFTVEAEGFKKSSELVVVPNQLEIKPLKQEIALVNEGGTDKVRIRNSFDAEVDSTDLALATQFIKAKASLEISPAEQEVTAVAVDETPRTESPKTDPKNNGSVSNDDIIGIAYDDAKQTQKDANEMRRNSDAAQQLASQKNEASLKKNQEASELAKNAEGMTNQAEKMEQLDKAAMTRKEAEALAKEGAISLTLANRMDEQAKAKQQQADAELKYAKDLDNSIKSGATEKKMNELLTQKEELDKKSESLKASENISADINKKAEDKQVQSSKAMAKYLDVQQDIEDLEKEAQRLRNEAERTNNDAAKQNMILQAEAMEKEAGTKKKDAETYGAEGKQLQSQADSLKSSAALASSVMKEIQASSPAATTAPVTTAPAETTITATAGTDPGTSPSASGPAKITSPYVDVFVKQMHEAENNPKPLEREEKLAAIYQAWTDSLDKQIASLKPQLVSATNEENKKYVQDKIYELESSVEDKRQRAADSRSKVDNLKLQEALAAASVITPETTAVSTNTVTATTPETTTEPSAAAPENLQGSDNINTFYEAKLKENEKETNEYAKKSREQEIYSEWSSSLYDESARLKKDGKDGKAGDAEKMSREKQALAMQTGDKVTEIKAEHPEWVEAAKKSAAETAAAKTSSVEVETPPSYTATGTSPETATAAATVPAETTTTIPAAKTEPQAQPAAALPQPAAALSSTPPESVNSKNEYTHFVALKNESEWSKKNAERQNTQAQDMQKIADEQFKESQRLAEQSAASTDPAEKQNLKTKSDDLEMRSLRNQAKADSVKVLARNSEAEASSKRAESDLYLQSLDKTAYEEITAATGYRPGTELASATPPKTESTPEKTTGTPEPVAAPTNSATTGTNLATSEPVKTEAAKTIPAPEPTSTAKTETPPQPENTPEQPKENPSVAVKPETGAPIRTETKVVANTTPPASSSPLTFSPAPATAGRADLLKYYDALFDKLELAGANYSASKPIPVDAPMPEGLVFKVQIGAFRNPIPQNLFKGIKPITAESTPQGLKRYTAGLFQKFSAANDARDQVKGIGYRDAFVVAFFNGKRISMNEAIAKAKEQGEIVDIAAAATSTGGNKPDGGAGSDPGTSTAEATDVASVSGLFYAIQIGVFSKAVSTTQLYNISPLNTEKTDKGLIRYTTGRFSDEAKAAEAKSRISQKGISDAFVIAYYNGKRISLAEAKNLVSTQGSEVISKSKQEYSFFPSDTTTTEGSAKTFSLSSNQGIVFKVQLGAYKEQVPIEDANKLLKFSSRGVKSFTDENGLLVYTVGEFLEYESANTLKGEAVREGITGAFVVAFKDGKKMGAADALDQIRK